MCFCTAPHSQPPYSFDAAAPRPSRTPSRQARGPARAWLSVSVSARAYRAPCGRRRPRLAADASLRWRLPTQTPPRSSARRPPRPRRELWARTAVSLSRWISSRDVTTGRAASAVEEAEGPCPWSVAVHSPEAAAPDDRSQQWARPTRRTAHPNEAATPPACVPTAAGPIAPHWCRSASSTPCRWPRP